MKELKMQITVEKKEEDYYEFNANIEEKKGGWDCFRCYFFDKNSVIEELKEIEEDPDFYFENLIGGYRQEEDDDETIYTLNEIVVGQLTDVEEEITLKLEDLEEIFEF